MQRPTARIYRAQTLDVLRIGSGRIVEITTFEAHHLTAFGFPLTLSD